MTEQLNTFYAGTSGLVLPVRNKLQYPPHYQDKSRLCYYASLFNSVEINSSFYKVPQISTISRWAADVDDNFRFTFKLWRGITHNKGLAFDLDDVKRFMDVINGVGEKKGCLLIQFPASITSNNVNQLDLLLNEIHDLNPESQWKVAIEFRSRTWYEDEIYQLLDKHNAGMVIHDMPASITPLIESETPFTYLRFHGPGGGYRGSYEDDFLYEYAQYIKEWQLDGKMVYAYFNNTMGEAVKNMMTLTRYVNAVD